MAARAARGTREGRAPAGEHRWVAAAVVGLGAGAGSARAEHAARTGRHVLPAGTRIEVLEVYCALCRVRYESYAADRTGCPGVAVGAARFLGGPGLGRDRRVARTA